MSPGVRRERRPSRGRLKPRLYYVAARAYDLRRARRALSHTEPTDWRGVRILGYHRIDDERDVLAVRPDRFRRQLETLLEAGVKPIAVNAALEAARHDPGGRYFSVTFDDGYRDVLTNAVPILRELGVPATVFIPSAVVDGDATYWWYRTPPPAMTWDEIAELSRDPLFDFQAHGRTHRPLPRLSDDEARDEIEGSKQDIEARIELPVTAFCYPAGLYGEREAALVRDAGFELAVTTDPGVNTQDSRPEALRRTMIAWGDDDESFAAKVGGLLDGRSSLASLVHARRARPRGSSVPVRAAQSFFDANRRASERIGEHLPQAKLDIEALFEDVVVDRMNAAPGLVVADVGAGRSSLFARRRDPQLGTKIVALDSSADELALNADVDEKLVADITARLPFGDDEVDIISSRSTIEHLADVEGFVRESARVLKPGGYSIHLFASKFAPYALINQALPDEASARIVTFLRPGTTGKLGFPAVYDNSYASAFRRVLEQNGFDIERIYYGWYQSEYFAFFVPLFAVSALYELAISKAGVHNLAARLIVVARKR